MNDPRAPLVEAIELSKLYHAKAGFGAGAGRGEFVRALDRVSLSVFEGESVGVHGVSGCR